MRTRDLIISIAIMTPLRYHINISDHAHCRDVFSFPLKPLDLDWRFRVDDEPQTTTEPNQPVLVSP